MFGFNFFCFSLSEYTLKENVKRRNYGGCTSYKDKKRKSKAYKLSRPFNIQSFLCVLIFYLLVIFVRGDKIFIDSLDVKSSHSRKLSESVNIIVNENFNPEPNNVNGISKIDDNGLNNKILYDNRKISIKKHENKDESLENKNKNVELSGVDLYHANIELRNIKNLDDNNNMNLNNENIGDTNNLEEEIKGKIVYTWDLGKDAISNILHSSSDYSLNGVKYNYWRLSAIPTVNYSIRTSRVQKMFKTTIDPKKENANDQVKAFIKKIPIDIWVKQFHSMNEYNGEFLVGGENFVMEAVASAFLTKYHPGITAKLYALLYEPYRKYVKEDSPPKSSFENIDSFNEMLEEKIKNNKKGNVVLIYELFGESLFTNLVKSRREPILRNKYGKKKKIIYDSLNLLIKLHDAGLTHLDFTPENILISENNELRLCDLAKSTPIYTRKLRHVEETKGLCLFESCVPTVGKSAYMPPECWKIYKRHRILNIKNPLEHLNAITTQDERKKHYFNVTCADKYMLGILFIWIWNDGHIWQCSDASTDENFYKFEKCDMSLDVFQLTSTWPSGLKNILNELLHIEKRKKLVLRNLLSYPWFTKENDFSL
ncbi:serine/threonine protein kinase, FIKK family [Plasmodium gaboni]|uniref:non-specific serine/threonine protein kinase n=1 Tax=Plasmodium gaboni TaxID=647221 RepID=A0A151LSP2_9APIC|nr:serine/threonine protein kinase, FIKK family [Plasmodium gaboni]KYO02207.1 serine/threonine protein kinase, FIKK family [Plasmodium gaboni]